MGDQETWYLVVAPSPERALMYIDAEWAEPDPRSLRELDTMFAIRFFARLANADEDPEHPIIWTSAETEGDGSHAEVCVGACGHSSDNEDWIHLCLRPPNEPSVEDYCMLDVVRQEPHPAEDLNRRAEIHRFAREREMRRARDEGRKSD